MAWYDEFPALDSEALRALKQGIDGAFREFTRAYGETIERAFEPLQQALIGTERVLIGAPWPLVVGTLAALAWFCSRSWRVTLGSVLTLLLIGWFGMWEDTMKTVSMITVSTALA